MCQRIVNSQTAGAVAPFYSAPHRERETGALKSKNCGNAKSEDWCRGCEGFLFLFVFLPFVGLLAGHIACEWFYGMVQKRWLKFAECERLKSGS